MTADGIERTATIERLNVNLTFVVTSDPTGTFRTIIVYDKEDIGVHIRNVIVGFDGWLAQLEQFLYEKGELGKAHPVPPAKVCFQVNEKATHMALTVRSESKEPISDFALLFLVTTWIKELKKLVPGATNGRS